MERPRGNKEWEIGKWRGEGSRTGGRKEITECSRLSPGPRARYTDPRTRQQPNTQGSSVAGFLPDSTVSVPEEAKSERCFPTLGSFALQADNGF